MAFDVSRFQGQAGPKVKARERENGRETHAGPFVDYEHGSIGEMRTVEGVADAPFGTDR
jgi:hypothetical protein